MEVLRADHLGMCFGVRDAIALAFGRAEIAPLTILGDLVHNPDVLGALRTRGIAIAGDPAQVQTHTVMVTAHGASQRALARTRARGISELKKRRTMFRKLRRRESPALGGAVPTISRTRPLRNSLSRVP